MDVKWCHYQADNVPILVVSRSRGMRISASVGDSTMKAVRVMSGSCEGGLRVTRGPAELAGDLNSRSAPVGVWSANLSV
jgi:hypothetical protein